MCEPVVPKTGGSASHPAPALPLDAIDLTHLPNHLFSIMLWLSNRISAPPRGVQGTQQGG